jgi:citrate synthase
VLRRTARDLGAPRFEIAEALEKARLEELHARRPDRVLATNVEFWSAVVLGLRRGTGAHVHVDVHLCPGGRLERAHPGAEEAAAAGGPAAIYVGPPTSKPEEVEGWGQIPHGV